MQSGASGKDFGLRLRDPPSSCLPHCSSASLRAGDRLVDSPPQGAPKRKRLEREWGWPALVAPPRPYCSWASQRRAQRAQGRGSQGMSARGTSERGWEGREPRRRAAVGGWGDPSHGPGWRRAGWQVSAQGWGGARGPWNFLMKVGESPVLLLSPRFCHLQPSGVLTPSTCWN